MKMRRIFLRSLLLAALTLTLVYVYVQVGLLPGELKNFVVQKTEELTGEKVIFDKVLYVPFRGLSFSNFKIVNAASRVVLFSAKTVALDVKVIPFLKEKKLIVRNVFLDSPLFDWSLKNRREPRAKPAPPPKTKISGQITVPVVPDNDEPKLGGLDSGPDIFLPENVYLEQFEIVSGRVFIREAPEKSVTEWITGINVKMGFQKPPVIHITGSFDLGQKLYARTRFEGTWDLKKARYDFYLGSHAQKIPDWLLGYQQKNPLILQKGSLDLKIHLANAPSTEKIALFHAKVNLNKAFLSAQQTEISGNLNFKVQGAFDFERRTLGRYEGSLGLDRLRVANIPGGMPNLEDLNGVIAFKPDLLKTESLMGACQQIVFEARGSLTSFSNPVFEGTVRTRSTLSELLSVLPKNLTREPLKGWRLDGLCQTTTSVKSSFKKGAAVLWNSFITLRDGTAKNSDKKIDVADISSEISLNPQGIRLAKTRLFAFKKIYFLDGFIPAHAGQSADFSVRSQDLSLWLSYAWAQDLLDIKNAKIAYPGIRGNLSGKVSDFKKPFLNLKGNFQADLQKLTPLAVPKAPALKDLDLKGSLDGRFILKGSWDAPLDWDLKLDGKSDSLSVKKFRLDDFEAQIRMKNRILNIPYLHTHPYHGSGGFRSSFDLSKPDVPFDGRLYFNDLDLALVASDLDLKQKGLAGKTTFAAVLKGHLKSQSSFHGDGHINIRKGHLWKTDLFKDMGRLPLVTVIGLDEVDFRALNANFKIRNKKITTQNLTLDSDTVHLIFKGSVGFDQTLDLIMWIRYSNDVIRGAFDTGGIVPFIIEKAEQFISQYKISGTLKAPKNEKILVPQL